MRRETARTRRLNNAKYLIVPDAECSEISNSDFLYIGRPCKGRDCNKIGHAITNPQRSTVGGYFLYDRRDTKPQTMNANLFL